MQLNYVLADLFAKGSLPRSAHSALPRAPVQPSRERRHPLRRSLARLGSWRG
jgi:hypothetical protein